MANSTLPLIFILFILAGFFDSFQSIVLGSLASGISPLSKTHYTTPNLKPSTVSASNFSVGDTQAAVTRPPAQKLEPPLGGFLARRRTSQRYL